MTRCPLAVVLLVSSLVACSTVDSADLRTSGISASIVVASGSGGPNVRVGLSAGGLTTVKLEGDDSLTASSGGKSVTLDNSRFLGVDNYSAHIVGSTAPGTRVVVTLERGDDQSTRSSVELPGPIKVVSPINQARWSRKRDLVIGVNHASGSIRVNWTGSCVLDGTTGLSFDEGRPIVIPGSQLSLVEQTGQKQPKRCLVTFIVTRIVRGQLGDAFKNGQITGERSTSVVVRSAP